MTEDEATMPTAAIQALGPEIAPARRKPTASDRHSAWLELHDTGRWSYRRIALSMGKSVRAIKAGIALARKKKADGPTNAEACGGELTRYLETHPSYADDRVVQDWLRTQRRPLA